MLDLTIVVAMGLNGVIGKDNKLPWHIPSDLQHFRNVTKGKPVIMGRKTHESIGRCLPGRANIVLTNNINYSGYSGSHIVHSVTDALQCAADMAGAASEVVVIGGAEIYKTLLPKATKMIVTIVDAELEGDAFFPEFDWKEWRCIVSENKDHTPSDSHRYQIQHLLRI